MPGDGWTPENLTVDWIYQHQGGTQGACLSSDYVFGKEGEQSVSFPPRDVVLPTPTALIYHIGVYTCSFQFTGLLGSNWSSHFYPLSRGELYFMLDEGYSTEISSIEVSPKQFPQFNHSSPASALAEFQRAM